jgi:hypothetical protein
MNYIRKIITKYSRIKKDKLLKKVDKNYELNTFEFFEVKKFYKKVANEKKLLKIKNSWIQLFQDSKIKVNKIDYYINDINYKNFINQKTIVNSMHDFIKKEKTIMGSIVMNLSDVVVKDNSLLIFYNKNLAIQETYGDKDWLQFRLDKWPTAHNSHIAKINFYNKKFYKRINTYIIEKKLKIINKPAIYLSGITEDNFFHWIFDVMPKLYALEKFSSLRKLPIIVRNPLNKYQIEMFKIFGVKNEIIYTNGKSFKAKNLFVPVLPSPPAYSKPVITWLKKKFFTKVKKNPLNKKNRIYISRKDAKHRKVINDQQISDCLKQFNFKTLILSQMSLREQINAFRNAECIVFSHGSAGSHLIFAPKNCKVIELQSPSQLNNMFGCMAKILDYKYGFLVGSENKQSNFNYTINLGKLLKLVKKTL